MQISLRGKVIVITGASRGIGRAIAQYLGDLGASIVINYNQNEDAAYQLSTKLKEKGVSNLVIRADVTHEEEVKSMCMQVRETYGKIDVLINNAGICNDQLMPIMTYSNWLEVMNTNLNGVFLCSKYFSREMIRKRRGKIINIASYKGQVGSRGQCNYSASKNGVIALTKSIAKELNHFNISVNAICPGFIPSDLNKSNAKKISDAQKQSLMQIENNKQDLVNFVAFCCSDYMKSVTGQVFNIDSRLL